MLVLGIAFNTRSERKVFAMDIICLNLQTSECFFNPVQWRFTALLHRLNSLLKIKWFLTLLRNICAILLSRIDCCDQKATFAKLFMSLSRNYVSCHVNKCHHLNSCQPLCLPGRLNPGCIEYWILNIGILASFSHLPPTRSLLFDLCLAEATTRLRLPSVYLSPFTSFVWWRLWILLIYSWVPGEGGKWCFFLFFFLGGGGGVGI